jgi:hypothetical protein
MQLTLSWSHFPSRQAVLLGLRILFSPVAYREGASSRSPNLPHQDKKAIKMPFPGADRAAQ